MNSAMYVYTTSQELVTSQFCSILGGVLCSIN